MTHTTCVPSVGTIRATALAAAVFVGAAIASAALTLAGVRWVTVGAPYDALLATRHVAVELLAHNALVVLWPLALVELGWARMRAARWVGDALIAGQVLGHGALIGTALAQRPELWRYLPHLPFEALALALPAGAWLRCRAGAGPAPQRTVALLVAVLGLLAVAALLETYTVPVT